MKALETGGVGRPSTYASIIGTVQDRGYVRKQGTALIPTFTAFAVTGLLESDFERLVDVGFTAEMEEDLDRIAEGKVDWRKYLERFFLGETGLEAQVERAAENVDPRVASTVKLGDVNVRIGRFGPFIEAAAPPDSGSDRITAAVPDDLAPGDMTPALAAELLARGSTGPAALGADPATGEPIYLKDGPYGPYVQRGEDGTGKEKPARSSLPKNLTPEQLTLAQAVALLNLPRTLGPHPETSKVVKAGLGRFGPYVLHDGLYASLGKDDDVLAIDLPRALVLLAAKANRGPGRAGRGPGAAGTGAAAGATGSADGAGSPWPASAVVLKDLGTHPRDGERIAILDGRYGPYIRCGKVNATLPKDWSPQAVTLEQAVELVAEKAGKDGKDGGTRKPAAKRRPAAAGGRGAGGRGAGGRK